MDFHQFLEIQCLEKSVQEELKSIHLLMNNDITNKPQKRAIMDNLWDRIYILSDDSKSIKLSSFYSHPIWLYQGMSTFLDPELLTSRNYVARFISRIKDNKEILDYGGGFGTLALAIEGNCNSSNITLYDPYSCEFVDSRLKQKKRIKLSNNLEFKKFDVITCIDVVEHSLEPIKIISTLSKSLKPNGTLVIQNCFYPIIKCHIQTTFYLRYFFRIIAYFYGLNYIGRIPNSYGYSIYSKSNRKPMAAKRIQIFSMLVMQLFPVMRCMGFDFLNRVYNKIEVSLQIVKKPDNQVKNRPLA